MDEECGVCTAKIKQTDTVIRCAGACGGVHHIRCADVQTKDYQLIVAIKNLKWFCNNCLKTLEKYMDIAKNVDELKHIVNIEMNKICCAIKDNCKPLQVPVVKQRSFAEVAGNTLIIKPKVKQDTKTTREDITTKLDPAELELGITRVRSVREGGLAITCKSGGNTDRIKNEITKKLKNYRVSTVQPRKPKFKILDIDEEINCDELHTRMLKQNSFVTHDAMNIEVKAVKKLKKSYMAIVECDPVTFGRIMEEGRVCIGWSSCRVFEHVSVFRCFQCGGFNHKAAECTVEIKCNNCKSIEHDTDDCNSRDITCQNCVTANTRFNLELSTKHFIYDVTCPTYLRYLNIEKQKIKYQPDK